MLPHYIDPNVDHKRSSVTDAESGVVARSRASESLLHNQKPDEDKDASGTDHVDLQHEVHDLVVRQTCDAGSRVSDKLQPGASATEGSPMHGRLSPTDRFGVHEWDAGGRIMCELHKRWNASWHASFRGLRRGT